MAARYAVVFDHAAAADLAAMRDYITKARSAELAQDFIDRVVSHCESFRTLPHRGTKRDAIRPGLRTTSWRRTITIAFEVSDSAKCVVILGVFYRGRDVLGVLRARNE